jgi:Domain of unknown function (DUF4175)
MIRKQQQLGDRTFQQGQDQRRDRQRGQRGQQGQQGQQGQGDQMGELRENQQALRDQLKKLMEELRKKGFGQGQQGQGEMDQLGRAGDGVGLITPPGRPAVRTCRARTEPYQSTVGNCSQ